MRDFPSKLSKHIEESLIIIEDVNAGGTAPLRRGENSIRYQRWRLHTGKDIPPQSELRHLRSLYITGTHGPLTIEIPGRKHSPDGGLGPSQWDYVTLVTDLLWKGTWTGVAPADQPGLVVIRPDGGVV